MATQQTKVRRLVQIPTIVISRYVILELEISVPLRQGERSTKGHLGLGASHLGLGPFGKK